MARLPHKRPRVGWDSVGRVLQMGRVLTKKMLSDGLIVIRLLCNSSVGCKKNKRSCVSRYGVTIFWTERSEFMNAKGVGRTLEKGTGGKTVGPLSAYGRIGDAVDHKR